MRQMRVPGTTSKWPPGVASLAAAPTSLRGPERPVIRFALAPDDVVDLEDLGLTRVFESYVSQKRHDACAERLQLLLRVPHFAHEQLTVGKKCDVVLEAVRRHFA